MPINHIDTIEEVIGKTRSAIHLFYEREIEALAELLSPNFVWIGAYDFQYVRGREKFLNSIQREREEAPVQISAVELELLSHEGSLWAVYGRYTATASQEDGTLLRAKTRGTFVWKQEGNRLVLLHIHGSNSVDVPLESSPKMPFSLAEEKTWFEHLKEVDRWVSPTKKLVFRGGDDCYHFVLPSEIVYIMAANKQCVVFTENDSIVTNVSLKELEKKSPLFVRIHRGYLVNKQCIRSIQRYTAKLTDGTPLPIGKERYLEVKQRLHT